MPELLSIDVGCGGKKKPGAIGVDRHAGPGVDRVCDLEREPLPFDDGTVGEVFSSHCIEHTSDPVRLLREITRVCADGAKIELWHPYSGHRDAFLFDHKAFLNEAVYRHMSSLGPAYWAEQLGGRWRIGELVFAIDGGVLAELEEAGVDVDFAVKYLANVVTELGVFATIEKGRAVPTSDVEPRRLYAVSRSPADRRQIVRPAKRNPGLRERLNRMLR